MYTTKDYTLDSVDAQRISGYNLVYLRHLASTGKLPAVKRFRRWWFCEAELREVLKDMKEMDIERQPKRDSR